jgi:hypothetical protein
VRSRGYQGASPSAVDETPESACTIIRRSQSHNRCGASDGRPRRDGRGRRRGTHPISQKPLKRPPLLFNRHASCAHSCRRAPWASSGRLEAMPKRAASGPDEPAGTTRAHWVLGTAWGACARAQGFAREPMRLLRALGSQARLQPHRTLQRARHRRTGTCYAELQRWSSSWGDP